MDLHRLSLDDLYPSETIAHIVALDICKFHAQDFGIELCGSFQIIYRYPYVIDTPFVLINVTPLLGLSNAFRIPFELL